jgi:hypothetical protein
MDYPAPDGRDIVRLLQVSRGGQMLHLVSRLTSRGGRIGGTSINGTGVLFGGVLAGIVCAGVSLGSAFGAETAPVPNFAPTSATGWLAQDDEFIQPGADRARSSPIRGAPISASTSGETIRTRCSASPT